MATYLIHLILALAPSVSAPHLAHQVSTTALGLSTPQAAVSRGGRPIESKPPAQEGESAKKKRDEEKEGVHGHPPHSEGAGSVGTTSRSRGFMGFWNDVFRFLGNLTPFIFGIGGLIGVIATITELFKGNPSAIWLLPGGVLGLGFVIVLFSFSIFGLLGILDLLVTGDLGHGVASLIALSFPGGLIYFSIVGRKPRAATPPWPSSEIEWRPEETSSKTSSQPWRRREKERQKSKKKNHPPAPAK